MSSFQGVNCLCLSAYLFCDILTTDQMHQPLNLVGFLSIPGVVKLVSRWGENLTRLLISLTTPAIDKRNLARGLTPNPDKLESNPDINKCDAKFIRS